MAKKVKISKFIEIDMGHRVTNHDGKCKNLHGHRYRIEITVRGPLIGDGSSEGMVMDYSKIKQMLMEIIDAKYDHGMVLWQADGLLKQFGASVWHDTRYTPEHIATPVRNSPLGKLVVSSAVPTAENLAAIWLKELQRACPTYLPDEAEITRIRVWETPTSVAELKA